MTIDVERNRSLCIHPDYDHRPDAIAFDDRQLTDEYQDAVYRFARMTADRMGYCSVTDFGCGSGFKLMKYFNGYETIGYEIEPALTHLRTTYPKREWWDGNSVVGPFYGDMLVCADVIEHLADPVAFLERVARSPVQAVVLSTPALEILAERGQSPRFGPPNNASHVNEWTTLEFNSFVAMYLKIVDHVVVSAKQGTQLILAKRK